MQAAWALYAGVFAMAFAESLAFVGLLVPGFSALVAAGVAARAGRADLVGVILAAALGALLGDLTSHVAGRWFSKWPPLERRLARHIGTVELAYRVIARWGVVAVVVGRFLGPTRGLVPLLAGVARMPAWRFVPATLVGAAGWAWFAVELGRVAGTLVEEVPLVAAAVSVVALGVWWFVRRRRRAADPVQSAAGKS